MRKTYLSALLAVASMLLGGLVFQVQAEPGPNGNNEHGLCTAFFNGEKKGHEEDNGPGPFGPLQDGAPDGDDEDDDPGSVADLYDWCQQFGIGGNSDGRYDCTHAEDDPSTPLEDESDTTCNRNGSPGNGGGGGGGGGDDEE